MSPSGESGVTRLTSFSEVDDGTGLGLRTTANIGTANTVNGVTATEYGDGRTHITVLSFAALPLGSLTQGANKNGSLGIALYTFPAGAQIVELGRMSVSSLGSTSALKADTPNIGVGTAKASTARRTLTEITNGANVFTAMVGTNANGTTNEALRAAADYVSRTSGDLKVLYLNEAENWSGNGTVAATGSVVVKWNTL